MNIGEPQRIITIVPKTEPVPQFEPRDPVPQEEPVFAEPEKVEP